MVSTTINFSGLMCLVLALGPASVLSAPQLPALPFPEIMNPSPETNSEEPGNSETSAGSGINGHIPGGPWGNLGAGFHDIHRGPCGPGSGDDFIAGAGMSGSIPGGPSGSLGNGVHHHEDDYPCPEPPASVDVPVTTPSLPVPVVVPFTTPSPPAIVAVPTTTANAATESVTPNWTAITAILPPTFTTPISVPLTTAPAAWAPAVSSMYSTPLIHQAAPTASASPSAIASKPVFNAGSPLVPGSVLALAPLVVLAFFQ
ncbi:uncharacterized protein N7500_006973 [Penicillium coprophilum]|uniref:uncharacterized protein n=1 Tax=Penicillium coprophilum TaxID=36646 RepID=UPI002397D3C0|nr:uncharacterized protein N7500_006973 [Penicillium coprophilum]KAJ5165143.1 hypothetical protein N7500_006973 [Penicillium coprophilum]